MTEAYYKKMRLDDLVEDPHNARLHDTQNLTAIRASLLRFGQVEPLVVQAGTNQVVGGNGRLQVMRALGWETAEVREVDLDDKEAIALALALNRTAELATWDETMLRAHLRTLSDADFDIGGFSLDEEGLRNLNFGVEEKPEVTGKTDPDEVPEAPKDPITKPGDLWILGNHRLLCGDSTKPQHVERLMDGQKAQTFFIDPPYGDNVGGFEPKKASERIPGKGLVKRASFIANDKEIDWLEDVFNLIPAYLEQDNTKMVFCKWDRLEQIKQMAAAWGEPSALCVWDRVRKASAFFRFQPQYELCWHWGNQSDKKERAALSNVWRVPKELELKEFHPTVKPVDIIEPALRVTTAQGKIVLDLFGGSGTTLIAAQKSGRHARIMELDPSYCDVIVKRWEDFTGQKAVRA
jgi:DNA modification methylase